MSQKEDFDDALERLLAFHAVSGLTMQDAITVLETNLVIMRGILEGKKSDEEIAEDAVRTFGGCDDPAE